MIFGCFASYRCCKIIKLLNFIQFQYITQIYSIKNRKFIVGFFPQLFPSTVIRFLSYNILQLYKFYHLICPLCSQLQFIKNSKGYWYSISVVIWLNIFNCFCTNNWNLGSFINTHSIFTKQQVCFKKQFFKSANISKTHLI